MSSDSILSAVSRATRGSVDNGGQGNGHCPICGQDKFRFTIGDDGYLKVACQSGRCRAGSLGRLDHDWLSAVRKSLVEAGVDETAFGLHRKPQPLPTPEPAPGADRFYSLDWFSGALWGLGEADVGMLGLGWDEKRVQIPVFDPLTGELLTVIRRSLDKQPKSMIWPGSRDRYLLAPWGIDPASPVILVGGEKDVVRAYASGFRNVACFTNGDGPPRDLSRAHALQGCTVIVAGDVDARDKNLQLADWLTHVAHEVRVADLSVYSDRLPANGDVYDVLTTDGLSTGALQNALDAATPVLGPETVLADVQRLFLVSEEADLDHNDFLVDDLALMDVPEPEYVIDGWIPRGVYSMLYGEPGVKKTFALLDMARSVRAGMLWQGEFKTAEGAVLFYEGEGLAQLKPRVRAWDEHHEKGNLAPGAFVDRFVDLTKPEGVAAIIRTVRHFEGSHSCRVQMVVIDPLVEFMTGEENGEGMNLATKGLRALAGFLDIAVVAGHHTNASGDRARGADFHRMRAGSFMHMEDRGPDLVGIWQEKQKNAEALGATFDVTPVAESLVLEMDESLPARVYVAVKERQAQDARRSKHAAKNNDLDRLAQDAIIQYLRDHPDASDNHVVKGAHEAEPSVSEKRARGVLKVMQDPNSLGLVETSDGPNRSTLNRLRDQP